MYLGRIVAIGMTRSGKTAAMYRVSSRSFPNREAVLVNNQVSILPRAGFESDLRRNPYISYNCIRVAGECVSFGLNERIVAKINEAGCTTAELEKKIADGKSRK